MISNGKATEGLVQQTFHACKLCIKFTICDSQEFLSLTEK